MPASAQNQYKDTLSIQEASALLKVSTKTLRRWEEASLLIPARTQGGHRRYLLSQVEELRKDNKRSKVSKRDIQLRKGIVLESHTYEPSRLSTQDLERHFNYEKPISRTSFLKALPKLVTGLPQKEKRILSISALVLAITLLFTLVVKTRLPSHIISFFSTSREENQLISYEPPEEVFPQGLVLAESTSADDITFRVTVESSFDKLTTFQDDVNIVGILNLSGNTLTSGDDLSINPVGGDVLVSANMILSDTSVPGVGGRTGTAYSSFANALDAPEETTSISSDNDIYIGGDLEIDGTTFASTLSIGGDSVTDLTGTGIQVSSGSLQATLGTSIDSSEITDEAIKKIDLNVSTSATNAYALTYNSSTGGFTWTDLASGNLLWTDAGVVTYLTSTTDNLSIGTTSSR